MSKLTIRIEVLVGGKQASLMTLDDDAARGAASETDVEVYGDASMAFAATSIISTLHERFVRPRLEAQAAGNAARDMYRSGLQAGSFTKEAH